MNSSAFFHMTEGLVPDIMHDCLEGCLPYEVKELIKHLIQSRIISLPKLNDLIRTFPFHGSDARNKPGEISRSVLSSNDHRLRRSGK